MCTLVMYENQFVIHFAEKYFRTESKTSRKVNENVDL